MALIEARGAVVSKDALMERVWPGRIVEENNLAIQILALRKAFAADRGLIRTVSGRGYQIYRRDPHGLGAGRCARQAAGIAANRRPRHPARPRTCRSRFPN